MKLLLIAALGVLAGAAMIGIGFAIPKWVEKKND